MATQRRGVKTPEDKNGGGTVEQDDKTEETSRRSLRLEQKMKYQREQQRRRAVRWLVLVLLLVLAVVGFYYYLTHYSTDLASSSSSTGQKPTQARKPKSSAAGKPAKEPSKKATTKDDKSSANSRPKGNEPAPKKAKKSTKEADKQSKTDAKAKTEEPSSKPKAKKPSKKLPNPGKKSYSKVDENGVRTEDLDLETIRILRRPIPPADVDRPHILDILYGDNLLRDGVYSDALEKFNAILRKFPQSPRAIYGKALALQYMAREKQSNKLLDSAIEFFYKVAIDDESLLAPEDVRIAALEGLNEAATRRGKHTFMIKSLQKLSELKPDNAQYATQLGAALLAAGHTKKAKTQLKAAVKNFTQNHFAKAQLGFILYTERKYEEALPLLLEGIRNSDTVRTNPKFYLYAGDVLTHLNRTEEAFALYGEAVAMDMFPSVWQRSVYNEPDLRAQPWWSAEETGYQSDIRRIAKAMDTIASEAEALLAEGSKKTGYNVLFSNGKKEAKNCQIAPKSCALIESFPEAASCRRGSVKVAIIPALSHASPYVGPSNAILQIVLGLKVTGEVTVRVAEETRELRQGEVLILDESFEQEVWLRSAEPAVVMVIDVWHPDLDESRRRKLNPIQ